MFLSPLAQVQCCMAASSLIPVSSLVCHLTEREGGGEEGGRREGEIERERLKSPQLGSPHSQLTWFGGSLCVPVESMDV